MILFHPAHQAVDDQLLDDRMIGTHSVAAATVIDQLRNVEDKVQSAHACAVSACLSLGTLAVPAPSGLQGCFVTAPV